MMFSQVNILQPFNAHSSFKPAYKLFYLIQKIMVLFFLNSHLVFPQCSYAHSHSVTVSLSLCLSLGSFVNRKGTPLLFVFTARRGECYSLPAEKVPRGSACPRVLQCNVISQLLLFCRNINKHINKQLVIFSYIFCMRSN